MKPLASAYLNAEDEGNEVSEGKERSGLEGGNEGEGGGQSALGIRRRWRKGLKRGTRVTLFGQEVW